ncbi:non-homologous end-joining DNA ligase [Nocardioides mesophilus]|uniref:DNA ligase (ATP) n=1 Tax=Nocardioides mesophilus TaxID=433659 RepID=A0A7G9RDB6_9ACTN|nr:non-homologous end-joining DNA ligase [Nocardioides mesophilus]QNN53591.1 DNA ligase [Nocardioides mesophilus]
MRPMLATRGTTVPTGAAWLHEVKWDGMRVLVRVAGGRLQLFSRNENDVTIAYPELAGLVEALGDHEVLLDGEVVAFAGGVPSFSALADRMHVRQPARARSLAESNPVTLIVFDLLELDGEDFTGRPLSQRRTALEGLGLAGPHWQVPATYDDGAMLLEATAAQGLEGVVSKKRSSAYHPGRRSKDWLKFPHRASGSYVVGGWRVETGSTTRIGAVLVGVPAEGGLLYRGRVGSGIAGRSGQQLLELLRPLETDGSPFVDEVPRVDAQGTTWLRPEVVVEIAALNVTSGGRLRQPAYLGVREDLDPADLTEPGEGADAG